MDSTIHRINHHSVDISIRKTNCTIAILVQLVSLTLIHWTEIYPKDGAIQLLNNLGQINSMKTNCIIHWIVIYAVDSYPSFEQLAPVVRKVDSAIHWINYYPLDSAIGCRNTYPLDSDLPGG